VPTVTDRIDASVLSKSGEQLKLIANFGNGVDNIDVATAIQRGITVTNTPGVLTEDTADMTMALILAVPRRLVEGSHVLTADKDWTGWSPTWMLGHRIWGKRLGIIGMGRIGQAVAGARARSGCKSTITTGGGYRQDRAGTGRDLLGKPRPDAGAHGHRVGQLPAHTGDLSPAFGAPTEDAAAGGLYREHVARRGDRRKRARAADRGGDIAGAGSTCSNMSRR
jgi:hypothetical protein